MREELIWTIQNLYAPKVENVVFRVLVSSMVFKNVHKLNEEIVASFIILARMIETKVSHLYFHFPVPESILSRCQKYFGISCQASLAVEEETKIEPPFDVEEVRNDDLNLLCWNNDLPQDIQFRNLRIVAMLKFEKLYQLDEIFSRLDNEKLVTVYLYHITNLCSLEKHPCFPLIGCILSASTRRRSIQKILINEYVSIDYKANDILLTLSIAMDSFTNTVHIPNNCQV